jgi:hypothetical protein
MPLTRSGTAFDPYEKMPLSALINSDIFSFQRVAVGGAGSPDPSSIDVALLDMNHSYPNVGHDALARAVLEAVCPLEEELRAEGLRVRIFSFDVRRALEIPSAPSGRWVLYLGTGGPGHLDPRFNDGVSEESQGIAEDPSWEAPLFRLFDAIHADRSASLLAVCHTFGLLCRWSGAAVPQLRGSEKGGKSSGIPENVLTPAALEHRWFRQFSAELPDGVHFRVVDNRLFDLIPTSRPSGWTPISYEVNAADRSEGNAITGIDWDHRTDDEVPRFFGVNHHPEIIDREHLLTVLREKYERGEVSKRWYEERAGTLANDFVGDVEIQSRLTSAFTLLLPIRRQIERAVRERVARTVVSEAAGR